jgi:hypothetical protein
MTEDRCKELMSLYLSNIKYKEAYSFNVLNREEYKLGVTVYVCGVICRDIAFDDTTILFMQEENFFKFLVLQIVKVLENIHQTSEDIKKHLKLISNGEEVLIFEY